MLMGLVKSEDPRGKHVLAAFGSLPLLEWWSGFHRQLPKYNSEDI